MLRNSTLRSNIPIADSIIIGVSLCLRTFRNTSSPFILGSIISSMTISYSCVKIFSNPLSPSYAASVSAMLPSILHNVSDNGLSSSIINARIFPSPIPSFDFATTFDAYKTVYFRQPFQQ